MSGGSERRGCPFAPSRRAKRLQSGAARLGTALPIGILALVALAASAGAVAWLVVRDYDAFLVTREVDRLGEGVRNAGGQVQAIVDDMRRDALFLADTPAVRGVARAGTAGGVDPETGLTEARWRAGLAHVFSSLARAKPHYLQVRLIGVADDGRELVRVNRDRRGVHTIAPEILQAKGSRPYFREAVALDPGRVYVSPLEMNREHGRLDPRMLRVVRASTPVYGPDGKPFGAIVINMDFGAAMADVADVAPAPSDDAAAFVTDQRGVPLLTLTPAALDRFGPPTGAEPIQDTLAGAAGLFAPQGSTTHFSGEVALAGGAQIAYLRKVGLDPDHPDRFIAIGALVPRATVLAPVRELHGRARGTGLLATGLFLLVASGAGLLLVRMRRQLERRDARLEAVIENAPDGMIVVDRDGVLLQVNAQMASLTGYARDEMVGNPVEMLVPESIRAEHVAYRDGYFAAPAIRPMKGQGQLVLRRKDGSEMPVEISLAPIRDGGTLTAIASVRDVTDRVRIEEEKRQFVTQLEASNKELDDFAYIASHDLKEPLRGIHHYATFVLEDYADRLDDEGREKLLTLTRLTQRMEDLINDLLTYSRLGRVDMARAETDLDALVRDLVDSLHVSLKERGCNVVLPSPLPAVHCDRVRVREVFANLIANASKYNESPEPTVEIGALPGPVPAGGDGVPLAGPVFYVRDNGIGIPERHQTAIFGIFKRLHARDKYGGGTGAGLTIVKKIVEQHGGRIWLESAPGKGSTFHFTLNGDAPQ
jgi:PAS domain S-box-containing protein